MRVHGRLKLVRYQYLISRKQARDRNIGLLSQKGIYFIDCINNANGSSSQSSKLRMS
jgi:hypothetical protein